METIKVLVVDDEPNIRDVVGKTLRHSGYNVAAVATGNEAIRVALEAKPDLIVLDVMLPDMSGFSVTQALRAQGIDIPILFLTAKDSASDEVAGLTIGGDDYVTKPFSLEVLVARVKKLAGSRTTTDTAAAPTGVIEVGPLRLDEDGHDIFVNDELVEFSPTEFELMRFFMENPNQVLSKQKIIDHVWHYDFNGEMGIVESYVSYLRKKLDPLTTEPLIQTKRGVGYKLVVPGHKK
ncbi:MAG: response regulator transcription factor [Micrococcales bacterium]